MIKPIVNLTRIFAVTGLLLLFSSGLNAQTHLVEVQTSFGSMRFELYDDTPKHRDEFVRLAREGYYDGTLFYRVIADFLIQGGSASTRNALRGKKSGMVILIIP